MPCCDSFHFFLFRGRCAHLGTPTGARSTKFFVTERRNERGTTGSTATSTSAVRRTSATPTQRRIAPRSNQARRTVAPGRSLALGPDRPPNPNDLNLPNTVVATQPGLNPRARHDRPDILSHPVHTEGPYGVKGYKEPGEFMDPPRQPTQEDNSFPRVGTAQFVQSVQSFYNNLPKSGAMPSRVLVEDVLPVGLVQSVGIPADSELKMLGPYKTNDIKAYEDALKARKAVIKCMATKPRRQESS